MHIPMEGFSDCTIGGKRLFLNLFLFFFKQRSAAEMIFFSFFFFSVVFLHVASVLSLSNLSISFLEGLSSFLIHKKSKVNIPD